jgi:hypothetical protein
VRLAKLALVGLACGLPSLAACVLGTETDPGCHEDGDCPAGYSCRAGACFELTTSLSKPTDCEPDGAPDGAGGE